MLLAQSKMTSFIYWSV